MNNFKRTLLMGSALMLMGLVRADGDCCGTGCCGNGSSNNSNGVCCEGGDFTSKTFFSDPVIPFASATPWYSQAFRRDVMSARDGGCGGGVQVEVMGGQTSQTGSDKLARWFGLNYKSTLKASNVMDPDASTSLLEAGADLDVTHFNLYLEGAADFRSTISFCPKQSFAGVGLSWRQMVCENTDKTARWWVELTAPIIHVKNDMRLSEKITTGAGIAALTGTGLDGKPFVNSMVNAFNQSGWKYGKIKGCAATTTASSTTTTTNNCCNNNCNDDCDMKRTRMAELEFKVGHNWTSTPCCSIDNYVGLIFPTGNRPTAHRVFEAVVGTSHFGISWGSEINFKLYGWEDCDAALYYKAATDGRYLFEREETRSFDLVGKQWSRYMAMYKDQAQMNAQVASQTTLVGTSGINLMTQCVKVAPRAQFNFNSALVYEGQCFLAEGGWTIYARQAEKISACWKEGPALHGVGNDPQILTKARTIRDRFEAVDFASTFYDKLKIKKCDVDWNSAAHPGSLSYTVYGALGYKWGDVCYPTVLSVGGTYDFGHSNTAIHRWSLYGKLGVSY